MALVFVLSNRPPAYLNVTWITFWQHWMRSTSAFRGTSRLLIQTLGSAPHPKPGTSAKKSTNCRMIYARLANIKVYVLSCATWNLLISIPSLQHCLPDCEETIYKASVSAAPFRDCDAKNFGVSSLCNFGVSGSATIDPPRWGASVIEQYRKVTTYFMNSEWEWG